MHEIKAAIELALRKESEAAAAIFIAPQNSRKYGCSQAGCVRPAYAVGLCNAHYMRAKKGLDLSPPVRARKRADLCAECGRKCGAKGGWGLCPKHYRNKRYRAVKGALVSALGGKCKRCSGVFPLEVFDFHHIGIKEEMPSSLLVNASASAIAAEISKCILLCANCHRIEHVQQRILSSGSARPEGGRRIQSG